MQDAELLHKLAKSLSQAEGITEDKAIQIIRDGFTLNSELHTKIPQLQPQYQTPLPQSSLETAANLIAKRSAQYDASKSESQASTLEMRRLELEEDRLKIEQRRYDTDQRREDAIAQERKDNLTMQRDRLVFEREQAKMDQEIRRDEMKLERESARADQKFTQMLALGQGSGKGSEEFMKIMENQNNSQQKYFTELNTVKDNERKHTDQLRTDLAKIESDRDVELAKLKTSSDQSTADAIDTLVTKMDENFQGMMERPNNDGEDFLDKYNTEIEKVNKFQKNLTEAGLKTLKSQGVDVEALEKAHNITSTSEESTLDKIIGVGRDLYEKTIKPGMEEAAKNGSGSGTNAPSGLETAFETPDTEMEDRIRAEQEAREQNNQLALQENEALKRELEQYETTLYNKARQYGISLNGISLEELESIIKQYETIMSTPFNSAPQTNSILGMRNMASELKINTNGKTVAQVEAEVIQAQQKIEQQLDELPDYVPEQGHDLAPEPIPVVTQEPEPEPPAQAIEPIPISVIDQDAHEPDSETIHEPVIEPEPAEVPSPEKTIDHKTDTQKPPGIKRSVTAKHSTDVKKATKQPLKKFTTSDGTVREGKTPHSVAMKMAKDLGGTTNSPAIVELTDEEGTIFVYETRMDETTRRGSKTKVPRAKMVKPT